MDNSSYPRLRWSCRTRDKDSADRPFAFVFEQEVCGVWGGRKRLVDRCAGEGRWWGGSGCVGGQGNWETVQGDKCGRRDVGVGGRKACGRRRMVRRW
jgi:hypothetical protein